MTTTCFSKLNLNINININININTIWTVYITLILPYGEIHSFCHSMINKFVIFFYCLQFYVVIHFDNNHNNISSLTVFLTTFS